MVDTNITVYSLCMIPVALGLIGACIRGWWLDRDDSYEHTAYAALHSPSVRTARNAFDRRVALAVREAKQGARACGGCGFTNAMHATACVRCSAVLTGEKSKSAFRAAWSGGQKATAAEGVPASQQSDLQRRIRRRREWSRRVDAEGKLEWHRDEQLGGSSTRAFPFYVLQSTSEVVVLSSLPTPPSKQPHPRDETLEVVIATDESTATDEAPEEPAEEMKSIVDVSSELWDAIERTHVAIVDASDADASRIAYSNNESHVSEPVETEPSTSSSSSPTSAASANNKTSASPQTFATITTDNATNVELPFPAKLAQFITSMAGLVGATNVNTTSSSSRITLPRESLLNDSLVALATLSRANVRSPVRVDFLGEQGIDAGGVYREWFQLLNEAIVTPEAGIFTCVDHQNQTF